MQKKRSVAKKEKHLKRCFVAVASAVLCTACVLIGVGAARQTDSVYVAGNPDMYPIEYYDSEKKEYRGLVPEMLRLVTNETGITFRYITKGGEDNRAELAKNKQAEMVTAVTPEDEIELSKIIPVMTSETETGEITYCVGFTSIASEEIIEKITTALEKISPAQKDGLLLKYAEANRAMPTLHFVLIVSGAAMLSCIISLLTVLFVRLSEKKKEKSKGYVDELTGVGNGQYYLHSFENLISEQAKNLYVGAYIAFNAEKIENMWGKSTCEDIEKAAAAHLNTLASPAEYLSRLKSGVFFLLLQAETEEGTKQRTGEIVGSLNRSLENINKDWKDLFHTGAFRLCEHPGSNAETTVYNAKQGYLSAVAENIPYIICSGKEIRKSKNAERLRSQISDGIKNGEFKIYMQFITESENGEICGAEVLSRWQNPEYGLLQPGAYIGLLKETGNIVGHDYNVLNSVCAQLEKWQNTPLEKLFLTCNFTRSSVCLPDFSKTVEEITSKYNFPHEKLVLEITEDTLGQDSKTISENIVRCSEMGFKIAIDDMGAGFSSLADLYDNEINVVKVERDFLVSCNTERRKTMLRDVVTLIHNSGALVICEGIENSAQQEMLHSIGCDMMQGFYHSRVLPLSECERFVNKKSIYQGKML